MVAVLASAVPGLAAAVEKTKTYPVSGATPIELYRSIGQNGPKVGVGRVIALTTFDLKWSRDYRAENSTCRLVSAKPSLTITYTLPKPKGRLSAAVQARWDTFLDGVRRHEKVHGDIIKEMVATIEATTIGYSVADDPKCQKIRKDITVPLAEASRIQRERSREFDRIELNDGGNVHRLILTFVNDGG